MSEHVQKTVELIDGKIAWLQECRAMVLKLDAEFLEALQPLPPVKAPVREQKPKPRLSRRPAAMHRVSAKNANGGKLRERVLVMARMAEPFKTAVVASAGGFDHKVASNLITQATAKGWLKRVGVGQYQRTASFPAGDRETVQTPKPAMELRPWPKAEKPAKAKTPKAAPTPPAPGRLHIAGLDDGNDGESLHEKLGRALAELEKAKEAGHTTLEKILTDKVKKLQERIEDGEK